MCMLSFIPAGIDAPVDELWSGADANPDGHGWAMVDAINRTLTVQRSMNPWEAIDSFAEARKRDMSGPAIFHSRIATSGLTDITGCHPFYVGKDRRTVVAHNGILFAPKGRRSDTRIFAEDIAPIRFANLDRAKTQRKLERYCGHGNKLVFLTVNPIRNRFAYIVNESAGHWSSRSECWHSNWDYLRWSYSGDTLTGGTVSTGSVWDGSKHVPFRGSESDVPTVSGMSPWPCMICGECNTVDQLTMYCEHCSSCNDCGAKEYDCMCWLPPDERSEFRCPSCSRSFDACDCGADSAIVLESPRQMTLNLKPSH